jgi:hypothetical protein
VEDLILGAVSLLGTMVRQSSIHPHRSIRLIPVLFLALIVING